MRLLRALPLFVLLLTACGDKGSDSPLGPEDEALSPTTFGIRHDRALDEYEAIGANRSPYDTADYPDFAPVVAFSYSLDGSDAADYVASGTLVRPDWILTAGHNFYTEEQDVPAPPQGITVLAGADPNAPDGEYEVAEIVFHPLWTDDFPTAFDLCLVRLTRPVTGVPLAAINLDPVEPVGGTVWFAGFGDYSAQPGQDPEAFSPRHALQNVLDRAVFDTGTDASGSGWTGGSLAVDFDSPLEDINSLGDDFVSDEEAYLGAGSSATAALPLEGTTVAGDSGGPLFVRVGGRWLVAGVLSEGLAEPVPDHEDSSYGDVSLFVRTAAHRQWLEAILPALGPES